MIGFIRLTTYNNSVILFRSSQIACLCEAHPDVSDYKVGGRSLVGLVGSADHDGVWMVQESVEEILKLISGSEKAKP